jgi:hypothetical protein
VIASVNRPDTQNVFVGVSRDGGSLLQMFLDCWGTTGPIWLFDGNPVTGEYTGTDVTAALAGLDRNAGHFILSPDGNAVIANREGALEFVSKRRTSSGAVTFADADASEFAEVNAWVAQTSGAVPWVPVLSMDGRSFFFLENTSGTTYEARRRSIAEPFGPPIARHELAGYAINGASADALTVFAIKDFKTSVWIRSSIGAPFVQQATNLTAFRVMPFGDDCSRVIGTGTLGACSHEVTFILHAVL